MALRIPYLRNRTRPPGRPAFEIDRRPPQHRPVFDSLFDELVQTRLRYEDLRTADSSAIELIATRTRLHALRASIAAHRNGRI